MKISECHQSSCATTSPVLEDCNTIGIGSAGGGFNAGGILMLVRKPASAGSDIVVFSPPAPDTTGRTKSRPYYANLLYTMGFCKILGILFYI